MRVFRQTPRGAPIQRANIHELGHADLVRTSSTCAFSGVPSSPRSSGRTAYRYSARRIRDRSPAEASRRSSRRSREGSHRSSPRFDRRPLSIAVSRRRAEEPDRPFATAAAGTRTAGERVAAHLDHILRPFARLDCGPVVHGRGKPAEHPVADQRDQKEAQRHPAIGIPLPIRMHRNLRLPRGRALLTRKEVSWLRFNCATCGVGSGRRHRRRRGVPTSRRELAIARYWIAE